MTDRIIREFREQRREAESFSEFWQRRLADRAPEIVSSAEVPVWHCGACGYDHIDDSPPSFCPRCAAVKRQFSFENVGGPVQAPQVPDVTSFDRATGRNRLRNHS
jgi:rubrerythrin